MSKQKLTTIKLGGQLGKRFGKTHKFFVGSPGEAVRALCSQLEGFAAYVGDPSRTTKYKVLVGESQIDPEKDLHTLVGTKSISIAPVVAGAKRMGLGQIIIGAALIAASWYMGGVGGWSYLGAQGMGVATTMFSMGASMMLGGVAQLLSPQPKLNIQESPQNEPNTSLGPTQVHAQGRPVPLIYGEVLAGSAVISSGISVADTNR